MATYAGQWGPEGIQYPNGQHAIAAPFSVKTSGGFIVPLYEDKLRAVPSDNPGFTDELGNLTFFANPGGYVLEIGEALYQTPISVPLHPDEPTGGGGPGGLQGYMHSQPASVNAMSISHGLTFAPAGILCLNTSGDQIDQERVAHPAPGVTEIYFGTGFQFSGLVYLS